MTPTQGSSDSSIPSSRATLIVTAVALLFVVVPALFWQQTWFGRELKDEQITEYLADKEKPRNTQHALAQLSERVQRRDPAVKQWYPSIVSLARHPVAQIRLTSAWVMGQDNGSEDFHQALLLLVDDPDPMVARNAALSLAGFKDPAGRPVLQAMLRSFTVTAPRDGVITNRLTQGDIVEQDTLLARLEAAGETDPVEVRSPVPGVVEERLLARRGGRQRRAAGDGARPQLRSCLRGVAGAGSGRAGRRTSNSCGPFCAPAGTHPRAWPSKPGSPSTKSEPKPGCRLSPFAPDGAARQICALKPEFWRASG